MSLRGCTCVGAPGCLLGFLQGHHRVAGRVSFGRRFMTRADLRCFPTLLPPWPSDSSQSEAALQVFVTCPRSAMVSCKNSADAAGFYFRSRLIMVFSAKAGRTLPPENTRTRK